MSSKEYLSIKEFSEMAQVSTQSIYKRLNNSATDELHKFIKIENKKKRINIKALELYSDEVELQLKQPKNGKVVQLENHNNNQLQDDLKEELEFLKKQLNAKDEQISKLNDRLDDQLEKKDNQISELNQRLAESQELNRNQQELLGREQAKLLLIENTREEGLLKRLFKKK